MRTLKYKYYMWRAKNACDMRLQGYYKRRAKKALYR